MDTENASLSEKLKRLNENVLIAGLVATIVIITLQVISRTFFSHAFSWVEEVCRYLFIYLIFGGAALAFSQGLFISVDFIGKFLPEGINRLFSILIDIVILIFFITIAVLGVHLFIISEGQFTPALEFEIRYVYLAFPIFFGQMAYFAIKRMIAHLRTMTRGSWS